jgi:hypothetical protein
MIIEAAKLEEFQPTPASNQAFNDLALGSPSIPVYLHRPMYEDRPSKFAPKAAIFTPGKSR